MGEIATWSAVKTKVGLGKDSNECPTKAELLALSPTGTGENYIGLEISNASSYGNNETVQLSDIHKVTYKYTFTVDRTTLSFPASGGAPSPNLGFGLVSRKQKYVDGVISGSYTKVGSTQTAYPDWVSYNQTVPQYEAKENTGLVEKSASMTYTQNESGKKVTVTFNQAAGVKTYGTPTVYLGSIADIPASGGTAATPTYSYSQPWGWNGKTHDGGTISSGASVVWSENISGSNLGTTAKARTKLGSRTLTVTLNGKSGNASIDVYQAENKITNVTQGTWVVSISANPSTFTEQGGTSQISASARAPRTNHWSSGATNAASDATGTPTLSIPTAVTGFSLSGTTLTVAENKTANQRSVVVRATMDTVYKEVTVTQTKKPVTIKQEFHAELGNYYSYGDSNQIPLIYQWDSPDSSGTTDIWDMTPGGYTGVWCNLPATGVINCMITGNPQTDKPMKARLSNIQVRTIDENAYPEVETNKGLSVGYSQQDYKLGIEYSPGMDIYFLVTLEILSESGEYGGGIRVNVALKTPNSPVGIVVATITLTPKNPDHPTIYFKLIYG